jgi:hypothetical protein
MNVKEQQSPLNLFLEGSTEEWGEMTEGMGLIAVHYVHLWKYHSEASLYNKCVIIKTHTWKMQYRKNSQLVPFFQNKNRNN